MTNISANLQQLNHEIRSLNNTTELIAVSKNFTTAAIVEAYQTGMRKFGENYPQELEQKALELANYPDIEWHFIGNIQSNKTKLIAKHATYVHTIAKEQHAKRLSDQRPVDKPKLKVMLEINISEEENKHGLAPDFAAIKHLADYITSLPNLELCGLMGMASDSEDKDVIKKQFLQLTHYQDELNKHGFKIQELSMGMSNDYQLAIECGATLVRIGSKIFGVRNYDN